MSRREFPVFDDMPSWPDNIDNLGVRAVNVAWHLMLEKDLSEISFRELAEAAGYSTPSMYQHYPTLTAFAQEMTLASIRTLFTDIIEAYEKKEDPLAAYEAYFQFARRRPRQYELAVSSRFKDDKRVSGLRQNLERDLDLLLKFSLGHDPKDGELMRMRLVLLGGGMAIVNGKATVKDLLATVTSTVRSWKK